MGRRRAWALLTAIALSGCAAQNVANRATQDAQHAVHVPVRATSSQPVRFAGATFICGHKLPEGAQLARECVFKDKLDEAYTELAELYVLYQNYESK